MGTFYYFQGSSYSALSTAQENNFFGKINAIDPAAVAVRFEDAITGRLSPANPSDDLTHADALASGLVVVWARVNTRETIWDAFKREDVFKATATRLPVRIIEIPTPNWIAFDEKISGTAAPDCVKRKQQERAYTSPIWYTP